MEEGSDSSEEDSKLTHFVAEVPMVTAFLGKTSAALFLVINFSWQFCLFSSCCNQDIIFWLSSAWGKLKSFVNQRERWLLTHEDGSKILTTLHPWFWSRSVNTKSQPLQPAAALFSCQRHHSEILLIPKLQGPVPGPLFIFFTFHKGIKKSSLTLPAFPLWLLIGECAFS